MSSCERFDALDEPPRALLPEEQAELDAHLSTCGGCAAIWKLGPTLRADAAPGADDATLIARAAARAVDQGRRQRRRMRATTALLVAAALLVASGAFAAWSALSADQAADGPPHGIAAHTPEPGPGPAVQPTAEPPPALAPPPTAATTEGEARRPAPAIAPTAPGSHATSEPSASASAAATPVLEDAPALLAQANAHRRRGESQEAIARYRELVARFPGSREEISARVAFGNLLLDSDPAAALTRFDAYLAVGAAALAEEACLGRAVALERLGREADAGEAWRELLRRFPASVHGERARARLGAH
jgi:tetratricopeptide (TPR) repeat protein